MSAPQSDETDPVTIDPPTPGGGASLIPSNPVKSGAPTTHPVEQSAFSTSTDGSRFAPGAMLGDRYRIVSRLGKGGMGEVYRADDLKLGTSVALKFLPDSFVADPLKLDRFRSEVRLTREISHPNVCRVYDFGEIDTASGRHIFLSMEYVDGEDLSVLLKRIGRLPEDKAVQIARQICAGLQAAHELGVVHRDLKPANIMLDGRGNARIMDFGVAGILNDLVAKGDIASGTPAYMAPEQLARQGVSKKSDIYSLGLVLYELFTGKPAFQVESMQQLRASRESGTRPTNPSDLVRTLDPAVETVILRCLEVDPARRPSSAIAVSAALPGGDPLAAALAAGETPSPELVALAGVEGSISPRKAWSLVAFVVLMIATLGVIQDRFGIHRLAPFEIPTDAMAVRAREMLAKLGAKPPRMYEAYGYLPDFNALNALDKLGGIKGVSQRFPPSLYFWFRAEPQLTRPIEIGQLFVGPDSPSRGAVGSCFLSLSSSGDLIRFERIAPELGFRVPINGKPPEATAKTAATTPDWQPFFAAAGIDAEAFKSFKPAQPTVAPNVPADARYAWRGTYPGFPNLPVQYEAASLDGIPVSFRTKSLWRLPREYAAEPDDIDPDAAVEAGVPPAATPTSQPGREASAPAQGRAPTPPSSSSTAWNTQEWIGGIINLILLGGIIGAIILAWTNIRAGRVDRRGAMTLGIFVGVVCLISVSIGRHTVRNMLDLQIISTPLARAIWLGGLTWVVYLGMEPVVRRRWPTLLISWTRLLSGRARDPLVWRDILYGCAIGSIFGPLYGFMLIIDLQPFTVTDPIVPTTAWFTGMPFALAILCQTICGNLAIPLLVTLLLTGIDRAVRHAWISYPLTAVFLWLLIGGQKADAISIAAALCAATCIFVLRRYGQLAFAITLMVATILINLPITVDLSTWYAWLSLLAALPVIALAVAGAILCSHASEAPQA